MSNIRTSSHIRTHRGLRSFRSCINATGIPQILPDLGRIILEEYRRLNKIMQANLKNKPRRIPSGV